MDFRILGPLEVLHRGRPIALGGSRQRALLALLLVHANETLTTDRLIDELWGERPPAKAAKTVQMQLSRLRKALAAETGNGSAGVVVTRERGYELVLDPERLDAQRFERLVAEGRSDLAAVRPGRAVVALEGALALWRGAPLAELAYEPFALREIARLDDMRATALEALIEAKLALGGHAEVVARLEALIGDYPYRERLRAQLMLALYRCERQADALQAFQDARRTLVEELGIEPGERLRQLERAILAQDPGLALAAEVEPAAGEPAVETPRGAFVGRERELAELVGGLDDAFAGRGRLFLLVGEPGIGKSRLADELIRRARERGARVLVGRCWEAGGAPAYWPWVQSLRAHVERAEEDALRAQLGAGAADLAQILPDLRDRLSDLPEPPREGEGARFRLFDSAARFLRTVAADRPLVLVLDDLHAADEPSLLLLRFLAGELSGSPILVVGTYRDVDPTVRDPLAATLAELAREQVTNRIELAGLTNADVARYIELAAGDAPPPELVAAIHAETEGNPLFVGEVARLLAAEGRLTEVDVAELWTLGLPQGIREVIGRRVGRLSAECSRVLSLASVLGREFSLGALEGLSSLSGDELLDVLDEGVEARVLASVVGSPGRLRFGHALIRQTLYDQLTTPRRVQLHRRAGEVLELLYAQDPEPHLSELAYHFFESAPGGDVEKALDYAQRAGDRALRQLAYEEAARFYHRALQALKLREPIDQGVRCELLLATGDALARAGNSAEARDTFAAAADLARASGMREELARAALGYGGRFPWVRAGDDERLVRLLEEALTALGDQEPVLRVKLLARLAGALRDQPALEARSSLSREAVEIARDLDDPYTLGYALVSHFTATWGPDSDLVAIAEEVTRLAEEAGDAELALDACFLRRQAWLELGNGEQIALATAEHKALADELRQPQQQWYDAVMSSNWALFRGNFAEAKELAAEALRLGRRALESEARLSHHLTQFALCRALGGLAEVEESVRRWVDEYPGYRCFPCLVALLECETGRANDARVSFEGLAADDFAALPQDAEWLFCLSVLTEVAAHIGDADRAATLHEALHPYAQLNAIESGEIPIGCVARYLGIAAATTQRWDQAKDHFEDALEINARMGARPWIAHTQHDYARMLIARDGPGNRARASQLLSNALDVYRELRMKPWVARATEELSRIA